MSHREEPVLVEVEEDGLAVWERVLNILKNVVVIVTCVVILAVVYNAYTALSELQDSLQNARSVFGGGS